MTVGNWRIIGVIIFSFGAGWLVGQVQTPYIFVLYGALVILWWLAYDFATEELYRKIREKERMNANSRHDRIN